MEKFISLAISFILITWYYINSLKFNYYFKNTQNWKFSIISVFVFTYIFFTVLFLLLDSLTISPEKEFLNFKKDFALNFLLIFEIFILILAPLIYIILYFNSKTEENTTDKSNNDLNSIKTIEALVVKENNNDYYINNYNVEDNKFKKAEKKEFYISIIFYIGYIISLVFANFIFLKINFAEFFQINNSVKTKQPDNYFVYENNNDSTQKAQLIFGNKVPFGLAKYAYIKDDFHKIIYFNFGLLMMLGKFLGFTYLPYGMSLMVHDMIFQKNESHINRSNLNDNLYNHNNKNNEVLEKISFLNELCEKNNLNLSKFQKTYLIAEDNKANDEEYLNLVHVMESKNNRASVDLFNQFNKIEFSKNLANAKINNFNEETIEKNFEENLNERINFEKKYLIKTDKSNSDENSNKSNFFSKSNSNNSNNNNNKDLNNNNNGDSLKDGSKNSVLFDKSENNYEEEPEDEKENLIQIKRKNKSKSTSIASNGLISLENKSKNSSLEVNKDKSKSDSNNKSALDDINGEKENQEYPNEENKSHVSFIKEKKYIKDLIQEENKDAKNTQERKRSENKVLTIKKSKDALITLETLSQNTNLKFNSYSTFLKTFFHFMLIIISLVTIYLIIYSKINILYSKIVYNICGADCGFLSYRFGEKFTLDFISYYLLNYSKNKYFKLDFFFLCFILIFRMLTVYKAMSVKGVGFLWKIFYAPNSNLKSCQVFLFLTIIFYTAIVLIYDFTYLIPDYLRFNGLNQLCDYTSIDKDYCGVSFFGLLFLKISMNFHAFMYFDILASGIFITTGILWVFRLIVKPVFEAVYAKIVSNFSLDYEDDNKKKGQENFI